MTLRYIHPIRKCEKKYSSYRSYKKYLAEDFNYKCGYCDDYHFWSGGAGSYHIDHFAPKSKFPELETDYNNLVYSCPFCNRAKSDDWVTDDPEKSIVGDEGYIDPCDPTYHEHLTRNEKGEIVPKTKIGYYMYKKLKLYLRRHMLIWNLTELQSLMEEVGDKLNSDIEDIEKEKEIKDLYIELSMEFQNYLTYLLIDYHMKLYH